MANSGLEATTQLQVCHRLPVGRNFVSIGLYVGGVVGVTVSYFQTQVLSTRLAADQRDAGFGEHFLNRQSTGNRQGRTALTSAFTVLEARVRRVVQGFTTAFQTHNNGNAAISSRQFYAVIGQVASYVAGQDFLVGSTASEQRQYQVIDCFLSYATFLEDVPRHTVWIGAVQNGLTYRVAVGVGTNVQRATDTGRGHVVQVGLLETNLGVLAIYVVSPVVVDIAANTEHATESGVTHVVLTGTAFNVTTADVDGARSGGDVTGIRVSVNNLEVAHELIFGQAVRATDRVKLLVGQERVATEQVVGYEESTGRSNLCNGTVVCVHYLGVSGGVVVDVVVTEGAHGPALVRTLEVVQRAVVIQAAEIGKAVAVYAVVEAAGGVAFVGAEVSEATPRYSGGATAAEGIGATGQCTAAVVTVGLQYRVNFAVVSVSSNVAAAVIQVGTHDHGEIIGFAIGNAAVGYVKTFGSYQVLDFAVVVVVLVDAGLGFEANTFEVVHHDEVHNAGNRVRTVGSRRATGQNFYTLNQSAWDLVKVRAGTTSQRRASRHTTAVDQNQGALRTETTQRNSCSTGRAVGLASSLSCGNLRQVVNQVFNTYYTGSFQVFCAYRSYRANADVIGAFDTRTGNDYLFHHLRVLLRKCRQRRNHDRCGNCSGQEVLFHWKSSLDRWIYSGWPRIGEC